MSSERKPFPLPDDRLALFDLDGTLLGRDYQFTDNSIYTAVQEAQEAGWQLGLSSDTPFEALSTWRRRLHMNGPIIAERGAVTEAKDELFFHREEDAIYSAARAKICRTFEELGATIWQGNPVEAIRKELKIGDQVGIAVLVNVLRRCSLSFHIRKIEEDGSLTIDPLLTQAMAAAARPHYPAFDDLLEDLNHEYGLIIVSREGVNKRTGAERLASVLQVARFAMVGNSISDYLGSDLAVHYAVGDADDAYKEVADYVADASTTSGAVEILTIMKETD